MPHPNRHKREKVKPTVFHFLIRQRVGKAQALLCDGMDGCVAGCEG